MSFSSFTKNELSRIPIEDMCCAKAELAALVRINGLIQISGQNKVTLKFTTENAAIARRTFSLLKTIYDTNVEVMVRRNKQLKKNNNYLIVVPNTEITKKILEDVGFIQDGENALFQLNYKIPSNIIKKRCCKRAYIRGAFWEEVL